MSMILELRMISDDNASKIFEYPPLVLKVIAPDDPDLFEEYANQTNQSKNSVSGILSNLFRGKNNPQQLGNARSKDLELKSENGEGESIDLDKAWQAIHFLLTGTPDSGNPPLNFLLAGGDEVGDIDVGYGPARIIKSNEVKELQKSLSEITEEDFKERYNPGELTNNDIYPNIWSRPGEDGQNIDYLTENFRLLKKFIEKADENKMGIVISLM